MKKILVVLLSICCCFAFVACNGQGDSFVPSSENESSEEERSEEENSSEEGNSSESSGGQNGIWSPPIEQE